MLGRQCLPRDVTGFPGEATATFVSPGVLRGAQTSRRCVPGVLRGAQAFRGAAGTRARGGARTVLKRCSA